MSRSGSCCLGTCILWRGLMLCLNGSKNRISPTDTKCIAGDRWKLCLLVAASFLVEFIDLLQCESRLEAFSFTHGQCASVHDTVTSVHAHLHV